MNADALGGIEGPLTHAVDIAQAECVRLRHAAVDIGHLFLGLLQGFPDQASRLFGPAGMKREDLVEAVRAALPPGAPGPFSEPRATPALLETLKASRAIARGEALSFEHAIIAICRREDTLPARILRSFGVDPKEIETAALLTLALAPGAVIEEEEEADGAAPASGEARRAAPLAEDSIIAQLARDLVERARRGGMDPVIGRETEVNALLETLARRTKNNPVLVGEPGVGKSAIVAGLAQRLAAGQVPGRLANLRLFELNAADLVAGTQYRGDFEGRILKLVEETAANPDIVLFIDEIHTILASGGQQGTGDAASLLKPHLARGEIRCIGATTTDEFRKFIERDRALVRRFQPVNVPEPRPEECFAILEGLSPGLEKHHGVRLERAALTAAITLSRKHIPERSLPDKALDLLDQACARKAMHAPQGRAAAPPPVSAEDVAEILRSQLGKSLGEVTVDETEKLLGIEEFLRSRVIGQDHVARLVAERIRLARRELDFRPERPNGVFLFLGPTGVGKTEVARCLAEYLHGSRQNMLRYDLSEFSEQHSVSRIIGSPPGYVGFDEEGHQLTSKVRSNPQALLLLDEIEKAHPSVLNLFLQVFEDGRLTDARGRTVSFSEVTIILTSNIGAAAFRKKESIGFGQERTATPEQVREEAKAVLKGLLPAELLNRVDDILVFNSLGPEEITRIARNLVKRAVERFAREGKAIEIDASAIRFLGDTGYDPAFGARHVTRNVEQLLLQPLARETYLSDWSRVETIKVAKVGSALVFEKVLQQPKAPARRRRTSRETETASG